MSPSGPKEGVFLLFLPTNSWVWIFFQLWEFFGRFWTIPHVFTQLFVQLYNCFFEYSVFLVSILNIKKCTEVTENCIQDNFLSFNDCNFPGRVFRAVEGVKVGWNMQKMCFFTFNWVWYMGCAKWQHGVWRVFLLMGSTFPDPYPPRFGPICESKWPKIDNFFYFRVCNMGCPIEWAYGGDHFWDFWDSDRLVNSAVSWLDRADRPRSVGKFSLLPFQILSFAQGRKNWSHASQWAACGSWGVVPVTLRP